MDDIGLLLDRAVVAAIDTGPPLPARVIRNRARRRGVTRVVASVALVAAMTIGGVIGLASAGRASETTGNLAVASAATSPGPPLIAP